MEERAHGIMFHHFHDSDTHIKGQGSIDQQQFTEILNWLNENHNLIAAEEWYLKAVNNNLSTKDVCLTFDDNLKCQTDVTLQVLEDFNLTAFWFVYTSPLVGIQEKLEIYRYFRFSEFNDILAFYSAFNESLFSSAHKDLVNEKLKGYDEQTFLNDFPFYTKEDKLFRFMRDHVLGPEKYFEIMDLMIQNSALNLEDLGQKLWNDTEVLKQLESKGHIIGLHSHSHPTQMRHNSFDQQSKEYETNNDILSSILDNKIKAMSHPCNSYNDNTLSILNKMGIKFGFRANMEEGFDSLLEHPRLDHALLMKKIEESTL